MCINNYWLAVTQSITQNIHQSISPSICCILLVVFSTPAMAGFGIKVKPNSANPVIEITAAGNKKKYKTAVATHKRWTLEVRGKLPTTLASHYRIKMAGIDFGLSPSGYQHHTIPVSGTKRSLTGNKGKKWEPHTLTLNQFGNLQWAIDYCNSEVAKDIASGKTETQALNKTRKKIWLTNSRYRAGLKISPITNSSHFTEEAATKIPVTTICKPTGYTKPTPVPTSSLSLGSSVTSTSLTILEQSSRFGGVCNITLSGVIKTNLPNTKVRFRYEHTNGKKSDIKSVTTSHAKVAMFSHTYNINNNPYDDEAGSIRIVGVSPSFHSAWRTYTMRCEDPATNTLQTETPPQLTLNVTVNQTTMINGQICPKNVKIHGKVKAGSSIRGKVVFIGSGTNAYQSVDLPYHLNIGQSKNFYAVRPVQLPSTQGNLQLNTNAAPVLRKIAITQGMSLIDNNNKLLATTGQKNYTFPCKWPAINPHVQPVSGELSSQPRPSVAPGIGRPIKLAPPNGIIRPSTQPKNRVPVTPTKK